MSCHATTDWQHTAMVDADWARRPVPWAVRVRFVRLELQPRSLARFQRQEHSHTFLNIGSIDLKPQPGFSNFFSQSSKSLADGRVYIMS